MRTLSPYTWTVVDRNTADFVHLRSDPTPLDSSAHLITGWEEDYLYFGVRVFDDVLISDSSDVWRDDGIEIGLDGLNDHVGWGPDDHQFTLTVDGRLTDYGLPSPDVQAATAVLTDGWSLEMQIPVHVLGVGPLEQGMRLGFTFGLHDDDDGGDWDSYMIWEGRSTNNSAAYGVIVLECLEEPPTVTPTAVPTWTARPTATATRTARPAPTSTPTAVPTATVSATPTCTATGTASPSPSASPSASPSPSATSTVTGTPVVEPLIILLCECRPVTVTPAP